MARFISSTWGTPEAGRFVLLGSPAIRMTRPDGAIETVDYPAGFPRVELLAAWPLIWTCLKPEHAARMPAWLAADRCDESPSRLRLSVIAQQAATVLWYGPILSTNRAAAIARVRELGNQIAWAAPGDVRQERRFLQWDAIAAFPILPSFAPGPQTPWRWRWPFRKTAAWWDTNPRRLPRYEFQGREVRTAWGALPKGELVAVSPGALPVVAGTSAAESVYATYPVIQAEGGLLG